MKRDGVRCSGRAFVVCLFAWIEAGDGRMRVPDGLGIPGGAVTSCAA
jgi:hypothetical protein